MKNINLMKADKSYDNSHYMQQRTEYYKAIESYSKREQNQIQLRMDEFQSH